MNPKPLVSVIVISYKNYQYIYDALDSVIFQDYSNIEIVISNDGSDDFNKTAITQYFKNKPKGNIKRVVINNNENNIGTVKNINKAIKLSQGKFIIIFAADDAMYNHNVVSRLINAFDSLPKEELIVTSQVGMYNLKLNRLIQPFISEKNKEKIKNLSPKQLFSDMATQCILPGSGTCYKREVFEIYGYFDERYVLVEDYSSALKLSRLGIKYNYLDFISFKHRDGGLSHGNINGEVRKSRQYDQDIINILKYEVLPFRNLLSKNQQQCVLRKYQDLEWKFKYKYVFKNDNKVQRRLFLIKNFKTIFTSFIKDFLKEAIDQITGKKAKILILGLFLFITSSKLNYQKNIISYIGLFLTIFSIVLFIIYFFNKLLPKIVNIIKFFF